MSALNFTKFVDKVESGAKPCTIRAKRKVPIRPGDTLHLFTGMRNKGCRKLRTVVCMAVTAIRIARDRRSGLRVVTLGGKQLDQAARDGFEDVFDMLEYFETTHGLPFSGDLIEW